MTKDRRSVLVVTGIFPPDHGGPASYVPQICDSLADLGWNIPAVITLADDENSSDQYRWPVVRIARSQPRLLRFIKSIIHIYKISKSADVIYLNGLVLEGIVACKLFRKKPVVVKVVGDLIWEKARNEGSNIGLLEFQIQQNHIYYEFLKRLQKWYINKANLVITPSIFLSKVVSEWGIPINRISVIHNAINTQFINALTPQYRCVEVSCDFIFMGRLIQLKRVEIILEICIRNGWYLKIIGDGPERKKLENLVADIGGEKFIKFMGHLPREEAFWALKTARVMTIFSAHETFPHVILEAKVAGVPVIGSKVGGIPELINHGVNGLLVEPKDISGLEIAMRSLLYDEELQAKFIKNSKKQIEEEFEWPSLVLKTQHVLKQAILRIEKQ